MLTHPSSSHGSMQRTYNEARYFYVVSSETVGTTEVCLPLSHPTILVKLILHIPFVKEVGQGRVCVQYLWFLSLGKLPFLSLGASGAAIVAHADAHMGWYCDGLRDISLDFSSYCIQCTTDFLFLGLSGAANL